MLSDSFLYREIHQQPEVLASLLEQERPTVERIVAAMRAHNVEHIVIAARGTSDNAARYAQYLFGAVNNMLVTLATPSLFSVYERPPQFGRACVIGISQSGKSPDIVAVLAEARRQGVLTLAITNVPDSPLAQAAEHVLDVHAGAERSVAATKTYTSQLAAIALLSATLANDQSMLEVLAQLPRTVAATLERVGDVEQKVQRYRYMSQCVVIGRGFNYSTAFELALKLKELTYSIVQPYSSADFQHGPIAVLEHGFPVIVIAPSGVMLPELTRFMHTLTERGAEIIAISNDSQALAVGRIQLPLPGLPEWASPLVAIVPGQLFAMHLAHTRGFDVDKPRGLLKVTETR